MTIVVITQTKNAGSLAKGAAAAAAASSSSSSSSQQQQVGGGEKKTHKVTRHAQTKEKRGPLARGQSLIIHTLFKPFSLCQIDDTNI
jgi:hypothetical protein